MEDLSIGPYQIALTIAPLFVTEREIERIKFDLEYEMGFYDSMVITMDGVNI